MENTACFFLYRNCRIFSLHILNSLMSNHFYVFLDQWIVNRSSRDSPTMLWHLAVLSAATFWTFLREFSPLWLRADRWRLSPVEGGVRAGQLWSGRCCAHAASGHRGQVPRKVLRDDPIRIKNCAPKAALIVNWRSTQTADTRGTTLRGSTSSVIGVRLSWRHRVHLGCGRQYRNTFRQAFDHETLSGVDACCARPHRTRRASRELFSPGSNRRYDSVTTRTWGNRFVSP